MTDTVAVFVRWAGAIRRPSGRIDCLILELPAGPLTVEAPDSPPLMARWMDPEQHDLCPEALKLYGVGVFGVLRRLEQFGTAFWDRVTLPVGEAVRLLNRLVASDWHAESGPEEVLTAVRNSRTRLRRDRATLPLSFESLGIAATVGGV